MKTRKGLRVKCQDTVNPNVRNSCLNFCKWLRRNYEFPVRLVIYLKKDYRVKNITTKELVSATFFAPYTKDTEPYIKIATGDYEDLVKEWGEIDALYSIIQSVGHEIVHYHQWLKDKEFNELEAEELAEEMVSRFSDDLE